MFKTLFGVVDGMYTNCNLKNKPCLEFNGNNSRIRCLLDVFDNLKYLLANNGENHKYVLTVNSYPWNSI